MQLLFKKKDEDRPTLIDCRWKFTYTSPRWFSEGTTVHVVRIIFGRSIYHRVPVIARSGFGRKRLLLLLRPLYLCFSRCRAASAPELGHTIYTGLPILILPAKKEKKPSTYLFPVLLRSSRRSPRRRRGWRCRTRLPSSSSTLSFLSPSPRSLFLSTGAGRRRPLRRAG